MAWPRVASRAEGLYDLSDRIRQFAERTAGAPYRSPIPLDQEPPISR